MGRDLGGSRAGMSSSWPGLVVAVQEFSCLKVGLSPSAFTVGCLMFSVEFDVDDCKCRVDEVDFEMKGKMKELARVE